ncbi:hypothetical protein QTO34_004837 [Cnephaeus nilssonii]|uniref:Amine oxidase n=1 Tax=Cnephaeus nilssonii TaxID=3371016 RepID=A0AA40HPZ8_CNENI|nr:hypothetical protein QTO34_004837 [Eptesicus nilssonii]
MATLHAPTAPQVWAPGDWKYVLQSHTLQEATRPLHRFLLDTTGFSFQDCHIQCLTFTDVPLRHVFCGRLLLAPHWPVASPGPQQCEGPGLGGGAGLVQQKVVPKPRRAALKYHAGEVDVVVLENLCPEGKATRGIPQPHHREEPHLIQAQGWSFVLRQRSSMGLQVLNVHFGGERIAYEVSVQEAVALYGGHTPAGMQTKYIDMGWGLGTVTHELAPGID